MSKRGRGPSLEESCRQWARSTLIVFIWARFDNRLAVCKGPKLRRNKLTALAHPSLAHPARQRLPLGAFSF